MTAGTYDLAQGGDGTQDVIFGGNLNLLFNSGEAFIENSSVQIFDFENYSGDFDTVNVSGLGTDLTASFDPGTGTVTVIPEPATVSLFGLLLGLGLLRRRRIV